jgi:hypothetical protein
MAIPLIIAAGRMLAKGAGKVGGAEKALSIGLDGYFAYNDYNTAREDGNGVIGSAVSAITNAVLPMMMGNVGYGLYLAATELPGAAVNVAEGISQYGRGLQKKSRQVPFQNAQFSETQQTYTMRQAGMVLAQKSKYSLQQTMLGNEAQYMHR